MNPQDIQPILSDGGISANWVMVALLAFCAFLLIRMLNKMDKRADSHGDKLNEHSSKIAVHEERLDNHDDLLVKKKKTT